MRIVLLGPPGAGKGSLAKYVKDKTGVAHISTGDMLREEMKKGTSLGQEIKGLIEKGSLVSDEIVTRLVESTLQDPKVQAGYMLDGYPRTVNQAKDLDAILAKTDKPLDFAVNMDTSMSLILMRLSGRRVCKKCGALYHLKNKPPRTPDVCDVCQGPLFQRADDNEATIRNRMEIYTESTQPIVDYYAKTGRLREISGDSETPDAGEMLIKIANEDQKSHQAQKSR